MYTNIYVGMPTTLLWGPRIQGPQWMWRLMMCVCVYNIYTI